MQSLSIRTVVPVRTPGVHRRRPLEHDEIRAAISQVQSVQITADPTLDDAYILDLQVVDEEPTSLLRGTSALRLSSPGALRSTAPLVTLGRFAAQKPATRIVRVYSEFLKLQTQLLRCVHMAHGLVSCWFCTEASNAAVWGGTHSSALATLAMSQEQRTQTFKEFVNELLQLTKATALSASQSRRHHRPCSAQGEALNLLYDFLFG